MNIEKLTIAHISDLHRSQESPISNAALLDSLLLDRDNYVKKFSVRSPDILIVSGDIIYGSNDPNNFDEIIKKQYDEAFEFLDEIAKEFFAGERSRIAIIPGNHDVAWHYSKESMTKVQESEVSDDAGFLRREIFQQAIKIDSNVKWSWRDRSFYRVTDKGKYEQRLMHFIEFYNSFYQGERVYSANPEQQFDIFDYRELGITILAFNSCFHNDHLNRAGAINPICIANANLRVRELQKQGRLLLATWHHNTKGGPYDQDYMDDTFIQTLIAHEVKFGFHGHQHRNEVVREENNIVDAKSMLAISAGTLCGGPEALPPGHNRQYNVLHFNRIDDDNISLRLFSRLKTPESSFENPVWGEGSVDGAGTMEFSTRITHIYRTGAEIRAAEKLVGNGDFDSAEDILKKLDFEDVFTRKLLLECYTQKSDFQAILQAFQAPVSNDEAVALINACIEVRDAELGRKIVEIPFVKNSIDPSVMHLRGQLDARLK